MASLITLNSLSAGYGSAIVLKDVDFSVGEKDFIGVIGPNGGGKTTLLKVLLGLLKPLSGSIVFNEELLKRNKIGYLPQMSAGDTSFPVTVKDVVLSGLMINKGVMARITSEDRK
jgi:zinc transport system ATP-binding protein